MNRRGQVLQLLQEVGLPLDDDDIAGRLEMNRHHVNQICRRLAIEGLVERRPGSSGKLTNRISAGQLADSDPSPPSTAVVSTGMRMRRQDRARGNVDALVADFDRHLARFETSEAFPGPSLYFHQRALERRRLHTSASELMDDELFFEYVYAVLPAWGMHRMGKQRAKVGDFREMVSSFQAALPSLDLLWDRSIVTVAPSDVEAVTQAAWDVISGLEVSLSDTRIVAGSKALHHVLPDLVPPIDRQYTFRFFTGQMSVGYGDRQAFTEWFPYFCEIGRTCRAEIEAGVDRGGFMATGPAKVIDNAIMGFMQGRTDED